MVAIRCIYKFYQATNNGFLSCHHCPRKVVNGVITCAKPQASIIRTLSAIYPTRSNHSTMLFLALLVVPFLQVVSCGPLMERKSGCIVTTGYRPMSSDCHQVIDAFSRKNPRCTLLRAT